MTQDWVGNSNSIFKTLGSSHHSEHEREVNDFYATSPIAVDLLLDIEVIALDVWEPACGQGHLSEVLKNRGHIVKSTDLIDRGYGVPGVDFLQEKQPWNGDIITNPPYKICQAFIEHALSLIPDGNKVCMFLKVQFMEGKARKKLFTEHPPKTIWISSSRINCAKNGDFKAMRESGGFAVAYAWYIWEKGFTGTTSLKWFN